MSDARTQAGGAPASFFSESLIENLATADTFEGALSRALESLADMASSALAQAWTRRMLDETLECAPAWCATVPGLDEFRDASRTIRFAQGTGVPGRVWAARSILWVDDVGVDPTFVRADAARRAGLGAGLFVPMIVAGELAAIFEIFWCERRTEDQALIDRVRAMVASLSASLERKRFEETARLLHAAVGQMDDALVIATASDPEPRVLFVNEAFSRLTGYPAGEAVGRKLFELAPLNGPRATVARLHRAIRGGTPFFGEVEISRKDGTAVSSELSLTGVADGNGRVHTYVIVQRDVTDRNRENVARTRLKRNVRNAVVEWQRTFDAIETPIWILDARGVVVRLNRHAQAIAGLTYSANVGQPIGTLGRGEPWRTAAELVARARATRAACNVRVRDEATRKTWDLGVSPVAERGEEALEPRLLLIARDVSATVALEESLRRSETMAAMGAIVAGVAHEVRNPLFGISATVDALDMQLRDAPQYAGYTHVLRAEVARLSELMSELLEYGRPPRFVLRAGELPGVIADAVRACAKTAELAGVTVEQELALDLPAIPMEAPRLTRMFRNLIENALQHSPRGEVVTVRAYALAHGSEPRVVCTVTDRGPGAREEDLPRLYEPFFSQRAGGTGLGLSIVGRIVEQHGGTVSIANGETCGLVVTVTLPARLRGGRKHGH